MPKSLGRHFMSGLGKKEVHRTRSIDVIMHVDGNLIPTDVIEGVASGICVLRTLEKRALLTIVLELLRERTTLSKDSKSMY